MKLLDRLSGTIVILTKCDRLQVDPANEERLISADEMIKGLPHWLGRTYRKFIVGGVKLWFGPQSVFLHDPLYVLGPTRFESKAKVEPKGKQWGREEIELPVTDQPGKTAKVTITLTLLPKEWREERGYGGKQAARDRAIDENEGISILRANREVLYGPVPYIIGKEGVARFIEIDRWWGCEIAFPPELVATCALRLRAYGRSLGDRPKVGPLAAAGDYTARRTRCPTFTRYGCPVFNRRLHGVTVPGS